MPVALFVAAFLAATFLIAGMRNPHEDRGVATWHIILYGYLTVVTALAAVLWV